MLNVLSDGLDSLAESVIGVSSNRYQLSLSQLTSSLSVFSIKADEQLNKPWRYEITFTSTDKHIDVSSVLSQSASFSFLPQSVPQMLMKISSLDRPATLLPIINDDRIFNSSFR